MFAIPFSSAPFSSIDESSGLQLLFDSQYAINSARLSGITLVDNGTTTPQYFFGPSAPLSFTQDEEYTLRMRAVCVTPSTFVNDSILEVYLVGSAFPSTNALGVKLHTFTMNASVNYQDFDFITENIQALVTGRAYLRFVSYNGVWNVSQVSFTTATAFGFHPASAFTSTVVRDKRLENLQFKVNLYDSNNNLFVVEPTSPVLPFDGGNVYIKGQNNFLGGTITVGDFQDSDGITLTARGFTGSSGIEPNAPAIFIGAGEFANVNTPFLVGSSSVGPVFSLSDRLSYNANTNTLTISGNFDVVGGNAAPRPITMYGDIISTPSVTESIIRIVAVDSLNAIIPSVQVRTLTNISNMQFISSSATHSFWRARRANYRDSSTVNFIGFSPLASQIRTVENVTIFIPAASINSPRLVVYPTIMTDDSVIMSYESVTSSLITNNYYILSGNLPLGLSFIEGPYPVTGTILDGTFAVNPVIYNYNFVVPRGDMDVFYIFESNYNTEVGDSAKLSQIVHILPRPTTTTTTTTTLGPDPTTTTTTTGGPTTTTTTTLPPETTTTTCAPYGTFLYCVGTSGVYAGFSCTEDVVPNDPNCVNPTTTTTLPPTTTTIAPTTTTAGPTTTTTTTTIAPTTTTTTTTTTTCAPDNTFLYCMGNIGHLADGFCGEKRCDDYYICGGANFSCIILPD